jgi:hypothetical protein
VSTLNQPIAISNVLNYLAGCLEQEKTRGETFDIGGPDILTYRQLMEIYAEEAGLGKRWILPVPVLTPRLSSYWIHLVTPVHAFIARPLAEGLRNSAVCRESRIQSILPQDLLSCREAVRMAADPLQHYDLGSSRIETCDGEPPEWIREGDLPYAGGQRMNNAYRIRCADSAEEVWKPLQKIGGKQRWTFVRFLWWFRGLLDRLLGGRGFRRITSRSSRLHAGDLVDCWRVLAVDPGRRLLLTAEMKIPGEATLEYRLIPSSQGDTELFQVSSFRPRGLFGILYWYALYALHAYVFKNMFRSMIRASGLRILDGPQPHEPVHKAA